MKQLNAIKIQLNIKKTEMAFFKQQMGKIDDKIKIKLRRKRCNP